MDASKQIHKVLTADRGVTAITRTVRPLRLAKNDALPAIVYQIVDVEPSASLRGDTSNLDRVRMQIDCWSGDYTTAMRLGEAVRVALQPAIPLLADSDTPQTYLRARFIDANPAFNADTQRYRWSADFYIWQSQ